VSLNRKISAAWAISLGVNLEQEQIIQETSMCVAQPGAAALTPTQENADCMRLPRDYTLISVPLSAKYDSTGVKTPLDDPLRGVRVALTVTPTESLGDTSTAHNATFVVLQSSISAYLDLDRFGWTRPGRSVIAVRALGGLAVGASEFSLPPDQRFYGGGSLTVRGYPYQSVGPLFIDGNPIGGTAIEAVGAELRQRIGQNFGTVVFMDAGKVTATTTPFEGTFSTGFGTGLRYYTPIGLIRLDIGFPGSHPAGPGLPFLEVYVGLGQVF
jgi:translocation and assembly module TamA